jgi:hypothetical protein
MTELVHLHTGMAGWDQASSRQPPPASTLTIDPTPYVCRDPDTLPRREWVYGKFLIRRELSATYAPGGVGKTSLLLVEALAITSGKPLLDTQPQSALRAWLWAGEEPEDELVRRIEAARKHYGIHQGTIGDRLFTDNGFGVPLAITKRCKDGAAICVPVVEALVEALVRRKIDVMLVDPFVSTHEGAENDTGAMQAAATAWKEVAYRANVAISLAHHTRKLNGQEATIDDQRGSSALRDKCRQNRVLNPMPSNEAIEFGIPVDDQLSYFSTGPSEKTNMTARTGRKTWYRTVGVYVGARRGDLDPGDSVGVVTSWQPPSVTQGTDPAQIAKLGTIMAGQGCWRASAQASARADWIGNAVAEAFELDRSKEDWQRRAKVIVNRLRRQGILSEAKGRTEQRKTVPTVVFNPPQNAPASAD